MIVRSLHLDDTGQIAYVDVRMTADEARVLGDMHAALTSALDQQRAAPAEAAPQPVEQAPALPAIPRPRRRLTDRELASAIDAILDREPAAGRPRIREVLAARGFMAGNSAYLSRMLKVRKRARMRALTLPVEA